MTTKKPKESTNVYRKYIDTNSAFSKRTMEAVREFKNERPWEGSLNSRMRKFRELHEELCDIYGRQTVLFFDPMMYLEIVEKKPVWNAYEKSIDTIHFRSTLNSMNFLLLWGEVLYPDDGTKSLWWGLNLFRLVFPDQYDRLVADTDKMEKARATKKASAKETTTTKEKAPASTKKESVKKSPKKPMRRRTGRKKI